MEFLIHFKPIKFQLKALGSKTLDFYFSHSHKRLTTKK